MKPSRCRLFLLAAALESLAAILLYLSTPSEGDSAWLLGYSQARLLLVVPMLGVFVLFAAAAGAGFWQFGGFSRRVERFSRWFEIGNHLLAVLIGLAGGVVWLAGAFFFTYLFVPVHLRGPLVLSVLLLLESLVFLAWNDPAHLRSRAFWRPLDILPHFSNLDAGQRRVFWMLAIVGVLYFAAFIPPNLQGAENKERFFTTGGDEYVIYPIPVRMLTPGSTFEQTLYFSFVYEDYHYGYPFYAASALVLLPVRLMFGESFGEQTQLNLLLLRQLTSVLPMIGAAGILVYLGTRFKHRWRALALFLLLLSIPGVFKYNLRFWHPDGLMILFISLTLFFLARDRLRLGSNFVLAALCCGLASAVKLYGFFFFLAVAGVLAASWVVRRRAAQARDRAEPTGSPPGDGTWARHLAHLPQGVTPRGRTPGPDTLVQAPGPDTLVQAPGPDTLVQALTRAGVGTRARHPGAGTRARHPGAGLKQVILAGLVFVIVMSAALVFSNPFVFVGTARTRLVQILTDKSAEMSQGYSDLDPGHIYRTGLDAWLPFYEYFYAAGFFLFFLLASLAVGSRWGRDRLSHALILAWVIPVNAYLIGFVAVKAYQYMLPGILPLYAGAFALVDLALFPALPAVLRSVTARRIGWVLVWLCVAAQFAISLNTNWTIWLNGM